MRITFAVAALCFATPAVLVGARSIPLKEPHEINITIDSAPDWLPNEALEAEALGTLNGFFRAFDKGDDRAAWNLSSSGFQNLTTFAEFQAGNKIARTDLGRLIRLDVLKVTWTKDPVRAPAKGIYVAIDISGQFTKSDRQCGYVILFKASPADPLRLARIENNYMTEKTAKQISKGRSPAEVERLWSDVSKNCPNYKNPHATAK